MNTCCRIAKWRSVSSPSGATTPRGGRSRRPRHARSILDAAQRLFERQGYAATTMEAIAAEAGVALKTVYLAFATKSGLLRALWDLLLKGDEDDAAVDQRQWYREVVEEPDPERQLRLNARNARVVKLRIAPLLEVIRDAAPVEPDTARALEPDPVRLLRQPARRSSRPCTRSTRSSAGLDVDARGRHPVDAQPPGPVAAAGRPARLDARTVRAVVRRHRCARNSSKRDAFCVSVC